MDNQRPMRRRLVLRWRLVALILALVLASGGPSEALSLEALSLEARTRPPKAGKAADQVPEVELLELDREMARFLVKHISASQVRKARLNSLLDALFREDGLGISYGNTRTQTTVETFQARSGNCLSFTILFVAMARHIGLDAYFKEVAEVTSWDRRGEVVVNNQHMFAEVEIDNGVMQVDFLPGAARRYRRVRRITDDRALAHLYNNLGVERMTGADGDTLASLAFFERALEADGTFGPAWINFGVAKRKLGKPEVAEESYRKALALDGYSPVAKTNLAGLLLSLGRKEEADVLLRKVADYLMQNPFHHFRQGLTAARNGDPSGAISHLKEAIRRFPEDAAFHSALAEAYVQSGDKLRARQSLGRALELGSGEDEALAERLQEQVQRLGPIPSAKKGKG